MICKIDRIRRAKRIANFSLGHKFRRDIEKELKIKLSPKEVRSYLEVANKDPKGIANFMRGNPIRFKVFVDICRECQFDEGWTAQEYRNCGGGGEHGGDFSHSRYYYLKMVAQFQRHVIDPNNNPKPEFIKSDYSNAYQYSVDGLANFFRRRTVD